MSLYLNQYALMLEPYSKTIDELGLIISATPTVVLLDSAGVVVNSWEGMLDPAREAQVVAELAVVAGR
jgi:hypothetical protein